MTTCTKSFEIAPVDFFSQQAWRRLCATCLWGRCARSKQVQLKFWDWYSKCLTALLKGSPTGTDRSQKEEGAFFFTWRSCRFLTITVFNTGSLSCQTQEVLILSCLDPVVFSVLCDPGVLNSLLEPNHCNKPPENSLVLILMTWKNVTTGLWILVYT